MKIIQLRKAKNKLRPDLGQAQFKKRSLCKAPQAALRCPAIGVLALALATMSNAQELESLHLPHLRVGVSYSVFLPSDAEVRSIFGPSPHAIGLGLVSPLSGKSSEWSVDFESFSLQAGGNQLFVASPGIGYAYRLPANSHGDRAFARALIGPSYEDFSITKPSGSHEGAKVLGWMGSVEVGAIAGPWKATVSYLAFPGIDQLNFNGVEFKLAYRVLRF